MMELVAIRDISRGEEVTIDYGEGWERAWVDRATEEEEASKRLSAPLTAAAWEMNRDGHKIRMNDELRERPYPPGIELRC